MVGRLLLLFLMVAVAEVYAFIAISAELGLLTTIWLLLVLAVVGFSLVRREGARVFLELQESLARGVPPEAKLVEGTLVLGAGVMLITPGFITDALGLLALIPPLRRWLSSRLTGRFAHQAFARMRGDSTVIFDMENGASTGGARKRPTIIDVTAEPVDEDPEREERADRLIDLKGGSGPWGSSAS